MTYDELQAALHAYVHRDDLETTANEPTALALSLAAVSRAFKPMESDALLIDAPAGGLVAMPADFVEAQAVLDQSGAELEYLSVREFLSRQGAARAGRFTIAGQAFRVADDVTDLQVAYFAAPPVIANAEENWLSLRYPDVWLHAAVAEQFRFTQDEEAARAADSYWQGLAAEAERLSRRGATSGGAIRMKGR